MALTHSYTTRDGISHPNAYARIVYTGIGEAHVDLEIHIYHSSTQANRTSGKTPIEIFEDFGVVISGDLYEEHFAEDIQDQVDYNAKRCAYNALKETNIGGIDWSEWADVLEAGQPSVD